MQTYDLGSEESKKALSFKIENTNKTAQISALSDMKQNQTNPKLVAIVREYIKLLRKIRTEPKLLVRQAPTFQKQTVNTRNIFFHPVAFLVSTYGGYH